MDIEAINLRRGIALTDTGETVPIDTLFDADGDECTADDDPRAFVAQLPDGTWLSARVDDYEAVTLQ